MDTQDKIEQLQLVFKCPIRSKAFSGPRMQAEELKPFFHEFRIVIKEVCKKNLPIKPRIILRGCSAAKCPFRPRFNPTVIDEKVCESVTTIYGCIWQGFKRQASSMGREEIPRTSGAASEHLGRAWKGAHCLNGCRVDNVCHFVYCFILHCYQITFTDCSITLVNFDMEVPIFFWEIYTCISLILRKPIYIKCSIAP